jgi:hypothetical protein
MASSELILKGRIRCAYKRKAVVKFFITEGEKVTCIHEYCSAGTKQAGCLESLCSGCSCSAVMPENIH